VAAAQAGGGSSLGDELGDVAATKSLRADYNQLKETLAVQSSEAADKLAQLAAKLAEVDSREKASSRAAKEQEAEKLG
jgi:hypothetical protein